MLVLGACAYAASSYKVTLLNDLTVGEAKLKAGDYTVSVEGKEAVLTRGKQIVKVQVDVEKNDKKFSRTSLEMDGTALRAIHLGGTSTTLVFPPTH